ncbi:MAG: DUF5681 domain-containing protein [Kiritimatiellae bacterium]|nr:DUF5681 domain-containing protein [Kiritimatiellia bacterium]
MGTVIANHARYGGPRPCGRLRILCRYRPKIEDQSAGGPTESSKSCTSASRTPGRSQVSIPIASTQKGRFSMNGDESQNKNEGIAKRMANLVPHRIKKGQILNPKGRGKGKDIWLWASKLAVPEKLIEPMRVMFRLQKGKVDVERAIILRLALEAVKGDTKAIEIWIERKYGKVTQPMDMNAVSGPLVAILNAPQGDQNVAVLPPNIKTGVEPFSTDSIAQSL